MYKLFLLLFTTSLVTFNSQSQDSWEKVMRNKKGTIVLNYSNSNVFISDKSGDLKGIECDIMNEFVKFIFIKYHIILSYESTTRYSNITFDSWKGNQEQVDDVCIIGLSPIFN